MAQAIRHVRDRRSQEAVSPEIEDLGLFKSDLCRLQVEVTQSIRINGRSDIIVDGFINDDAPITIVFAGRRRLLFSPLKSRLKAIEMKHIKAIRDEKGKDAVLDYPPTDIRLPALIEGTWRMLFELNEDGFQTRTRQFLAARWVFGTESGDTKTFGTTPSHLSAPSE